MKLIVGLGNPEDKYRNTRHNVGFRVLSEFADGQGVSFKHQGKFKAHVAELTMNGEKVVLAMPTTYYNLSGEAVRAIADFYKISPQDILVIHDELALPFGTSRSRLGGSPAGNNGIKSVYEHMGHETGRIRVGVWNELRDRMNDADFVLGRFSADEQGALQKLQPTVTSLITSFIDGSFAHTTHTHTA